MPRIHVFVDESNIDSRYMLIGGIWVSERYRPKLEAHIQAIRNETAYQPEFKWKNIKRRANNAYHDLIRTLLPDRGFGFNCVVIDTHDPAFHSLGKQPETKFYNVYFMLISRNILPNCRYYVYSDRRTSPLTDPMKQVQERCNTWWNYKTGTTLNIIRSIEPIESRESPIMQLADVILGALGDSFNQRAQTEEKGDIRKLVELYRGMPLTTPSPSTERGFNVWVWDPTNGSIPSGIDLSTE